MFIIQFFLLFISTGASTGFYDIQLQKADGSFVKMQQWQGKKIMIVTLPSMQNPADFVFLRQLDSLGSDLAHPVTIIGVPCLEEGADINADTALLATYHRLLSNHVIITAPMWTQKNSAAQHNLFKWLTHAEQNGHFNEDVSGSRQRFFINAQGELYGVVNAGMSLNGKAMRLLLQ